MRHYTCDKSRRSVGSLEVSTLTVRGPLRYLLGSAEVHLDEESARAFVHFLGRRPLDELPDVPTTGEGPIPLDRQESGRVPAGSNGKIPARATRAK